MNDRPNVSDDYWTPCDSCGEDVPKQDALTLQWANVHFCSRECRDRWRTKRSIDLE